jgi:hypothetical protein
VQIAAGQLDRALPMLAAVIAECSRLLAAVQAMAALGSLTAVDRALSRADRMSVHLYPVGARKSAMGSELRVRPGRLGSDPDDQWIAPRRLSR